VDCFAGQGYDGTRVRHIAERAGVSEAAIYRHYASAEALAQELFRQIADATSNGTTKHRLRAVIRTTLAFYRADPAAAIFILVRQDRFMPRLPAGTVYPLEIVERIIAVGQQKLELRPGQPNLLAAIFLGCVLRPIQLDSLAAPGALDLITDTWHDQVIEEAALAALWRDRS
jgi:AcrR family transcriptional regulator